jgi:hypothetical protein
MKTPTDRAADAIEAAEIMFAEETGTTLDLSPAAKVGLIVKIAAAILSQLVLSPANVRKTPATAAEDRSDGQLH